MDTIISLNGKGFGICAIDTLSFKSFLITKTNLNKYIEIGKNKFLAVSGYPGDVIQFTDFLQKTIQLYTLKTGLTLSTRSVANCIRKELSDCLRKNPININLTLIGFDKIYGSSLYFIDYLGSLQRMDFCVQGHSSLILSSFLDRYYKQKMNLQEAIEIIKRCANIIKKRFLIPQTKLLLNIVDEKGCRCLGIV
ncbi:prsB4 (nucleomorph) [Hemiselmis andersenii]|uniref:PrsB4 n=1 Tax=Hemiselmis andersenii TaxID=464988 RepID=A9BL71_HEMAN|nr:prsB4 [Hemiselmis andersenii]ABW98254.1 prsB4 [Hemiselmis andersenii]